MLADLMLLHLPATSLCPLTQPDAWLHVNARGLNTTNSYLHKEQPTVYTTCVYALLYVGVSAVLPQPL